MSPEQTERVAKALADGKRREILERVAAEPGIACKDLLVHLGVSQPTASHHIRQLSEAGLLDGVRDGATTRLTVRREALDEFFEESRRRFAL